MISHAFKRHFRWDRKNNAQLVKTILEGVRADKDHAPGGRNLTTEETARLAAFEFNKKQPLARKLPWSDYKLRASRKTGAVNMNIATAGIYHGDDPGKNIYFRIGLLAVAADFGTLECTGETAVFSGYLPIDNMMPFNTSLRTKLPMQVTEKSRVLIGMAIEYFQLCNGQYYPMRLAKNSAGIVEVY
jgi:hypothetical protein